jgi:HPt (histidine-containing phosphotransfer) domain-containing protein
MPDDEPGDVLDAERLADLLQLGPERFARLAETFIGSVWAQVDEIERGVAAGDASAVRRTAHSLKGSSRIYGAHRVADIAASLEDDAQSALGAEGEGRVARLRDEVAAAVAALHDLTGA